MNGGGAFDAHGILGPLIDNPSSAFQHKVTTDNTAVSEGIIPTHSHTQ